MARFALFLVLAPLLGGQTGGTVEGRVVSSATHAPIGGVTVTLRYLLPGKDTAYKTVTDVSGLFRISDLPEADYVIGFSKTGFAWSPTSPSRKPFHVAKDETTRFSEEMALLGILRGRVLDGEGRPVANSRIELAHMRGGSAEVATTNADGRFEISKSGTFTLMARPAPKQESPKQSPSETERTAWAPTYFPRGIQRIEAARIVLRPGQEVEGYEIRLRNVPVYRVRGVALNEDGKPMAGVRVRLVAPDQWNGAPEAQAISGPNGAFEFASVWARDWELEAEARRGDAVLKGFGSTVVAHDDVSEVLLRLSPPFTVSGVVEGPKQRHGKGGLSVWLFAQIGETRLGSEMADGTLRIKDVYPGRYTILASNIPPGHYLDSVLLGDRDVTGQAVDMPDGSVPIRVIVHPNAARIRGTAEDCRGGTVVLWGLDEPILHTEYFRRVTCDAGGRFEFADLRPGGYYACAFAQVGDDYLLADLGFARALKQHATKVRVEQGQTATLELRALPWPEY